MNNNHPHQTYFFIVILLAVLALNFAIFVPFLGAIVVALTLSSIFTPVYRSLLKVLGDKRTVSAWATVFLVFLIIVIPVAFFGTLVFKEAGVLYSVFREGGSEVSINSINNFVNSKLSDIYPGASIDVKTYFEKVLNLIVKNFAGIFSGISGALFSLFLALMAFYFLLKEGDMFKKAIIKFSPLADGHDEDIFDKLAKTINSVVKGTLLVAVIQGILMGFGFFVFGVPSPALWGAVTVLAALVPMVGTALVIIPGVIYLLSIGSSGAALGLLAWGAIIVGSVDNLLRPKLFERGINIHPFFILVSVLGGIEVFGAVGFLLGPLLLSLMFALLGMYKKEFKEDVEQNSQN